MADLDSSFYEGQQITTLARFYAGQELVTLEDATDWELHVYEYSGSAKAKLVYSLVGQDPALVMFTGLQTVNAGPIGSYAFRHTLAPGPDTFTTRGNRAYVLEYRVNTSAYGPQVLVHRVTVRALSS